jgi:hypothetical protein
MINAQGRFLFNPVVSHRYLRYSGLSQKSKEVDE